MELDHLLTPRRVKLYLADYFCFPPKEGKKKSHYVTIVVAVNDSELDVFCAKRCRLLDQKTNPFLRITEQKKVAGEEEGKYDYFLNGLYYEWIELYIEEDIPLAWGKTNSVDLQDGIIGESYSNAAAHDQACDTCNLPGRL